MPDRPVNLRELGDFLKARRSELDPSDVGIADVGQTRRRVPGLRREEVASLVGISVDYYTRIEQGRLSPSAPVLDAIADAFGLTPDQREYAESLARQSTRRSPLRRVSPVVRPQIQRLIDELATTPAIVFGKYLDILGWNALAATLITDFARVPAAQRNYVHLMFTHPAMRELYPEWESIARTCVAILRMDAAGSSNDPRLSGLVGELSIADEHFGRWWAERDVARTEFGAKRLRHPVVGELTLDWDTFRHSGDPDQQLVLWSAAPESADHEKLRILASWSASESAAQA